MESDLREKEQSSEAGPLRDGLWLVPAGKIAAVVTYLEMAGRPTARDALRTRFPSPQLWRAPDLGEYRALFRAVGEEWLWFSRLLLADEALRAILSDPLVEIYVMQEGAQSLGFVELDFREGGACEIAFFGLVKSAIGAGRGRSLMEFAIDRAWSRPVRRLWLHTCTFDHPGAVAFYRRLGFRPCGLAVEVADDPRPILESRSLSPPARG